MADVQNNSKLSAAQRNQYFNQLTRQHIQALPAKAWTEGGTVSFEIPKARLLSKIKLLVKATVNAKHASATPFGLAANAPFSLIQKIEVNLNNGFSPYVLSGVDAYFMNLLGVNGHMVPVVSNGTAATITASRAKNKIGLEASANGTDNVMQMVIDLPLTLNDRDPAGLILLQANDVLVNVNVTMGTFTTDVMAAAAGYTIVLSNCTITPIIETYSIPSIQDAMPDLSLIKLVHSRTETISAAGQQTISLPTGNMYRKLLVYVSDASGGEADSDLSTNFDILFNTADRPYSVPHWVLSEMNQQDYGQILPNGLFVFDFSRNAGIPNYGSARDYIDTAQLTEMQLQFNAAAAGSVKYIYETISVLKG